MRIFLADLYFDQTPRLAPVPLNIGYIAAYAKSLFGDSVEISLFKSPEALLDAIDTAPPDILGLACYIWNGNLNRFVADYLRKINSDAVIVAGGPNFRSDQESIRSFLQENRHYDYCVLYAGEIPFSNLAKHYLEVGNETSKHKGAIDGCFCLDEEDQLLGQAVIDDRKDLDYLPSPYLTGMLDSFLKDGYTPLFETNRGCPYHCTFCVWGISAVTKLRKFSEARIYAEIDYVSRLNVSVPEWRFADANFGILKRDADIARYVRSVYDKNPQMFSYVDVWWAKNPTQTMVDVAAALRELTMGYVAFQSLDDRVLSAIERSNISTEKLVEFVRKIRPYVSSIHTDLLVGLPMETFESNLKSYSTALELGFSQIGGGEVRMLPGSEMDTPHYRDQYGLKTKYRVSAGDIGVWRGELVYEVEESIRSSNVMREEEMILLRVIRSILYGCLLLGYMRPVVIGATASHVDFVSIIARLVQDGANNSRLNKIIEDMISFAKNEFYESVDALESYLADPQEKERFINTPPPKFNFWFVSKIVCDFEASEAFRDFIRSQLIVAGIESHVVDDLLGLSQSGFVVERLLRNEVASESCLTVNQDTAKLLAKAGWLAPTEEAEVRFTIDQYLLESMKNFFDERPSAQFSDMIDFWQVFPNHIMKPVVA